MKKDMKWAMNHLPKSDDKNLPIMSLSEVAKARTFHQSFPQYSETPLTRLTQMARYLASVRFSSKMNRTASASMPSKSWAVPIPWPSTSPRKRTAMYRTCLMTS